MRAGVAQHAAPCTSRAAGLARLAHHGKGQLRNAIEQGLHFGGARLLGGRRRDVGRRDEDRRRRRPDSQRAGGAGPAEDNSSSSSGSGSSSSASNIASWRPGAGSLMPSSAPSGACLAPAPMHYATFQGCCTASCYSSYALTQSTPQLQARASARMPAMSSTANSTTYAVSTYSTRAATGWRQQYTPDVVLRQAKKRAHSSNDA